MNSDNTPNLAGDLISEMQRTNNPSVFNPDNSGGMGMGQGQPQPGGYPGGMGQPQPGGYPGGGQPGGGYPGGGQPGGGYPGGGQPGGGQPINPQLQQHFTMVLQRDPEIQQKFADQQIFQQALQDPNVMMNTIKYYEDKMQAQAQAQAQVPPPTKKVDEDEDEEEDEDEDDDEDEDEDQKKVQFSNKIDDIDLMVSKKSIVDKLIDNIKEPLIMTVIFVLVIQPFVKEYLIKLIPKIQDYTILQTLSLTLVFFCLSFLVKLILSTLL